MTKILFFSFFVNFFSINHMSAMQTENQKSHSLAMRKVNTEEQGRALHNKILRHQDKEQITCCLDVSATIASAAACIGFVAYHFKNS